MIFEKLKFLLANGHIHIFSVDGANFLYNQGNNGTYQIDDETYLNLIGDTRINDDSTRKLEQIFYYIKQDNKPLIKLYTLNVLHASNIESQTENIKIKYFTHSQSEIVFKQPEYRSQDSFLSIARYFKEVKRSDLIFVNEEGADAIGDTDIDLNVKIIYHVNSVKRNNFQSLTFKNVPIKLKYRFKDQDDIIKLFANTNFRATLYIDDLTDIVPFSIFLTSQISQTQGLSKNITNVYTIVNFLISKANYSRNIETFSNGTISIADNQKCNTCWCKNICWATKCFDSFNVDLYTIDKYDIQCDAIRSLIENIIYKLRKIEKKEKHKTQDFFEFDGQKITLVN